SPFDLRDYALQELADPHQRQQVETHIQSCAACQEELQRLQLTQAALFTLADEEIPQRIAFVSDQVFEPSPLRRWMSAFWNSPARLGFASAAMLSTALIVFAVTRPAPAPPRPVITTAAVDSADIERRVQAAADKAAREIEARYATRTEQLVKSIQLRSQKERNLLVASWDQQDSYYRNKIAGLLHENHVLSESA